MSKPRIGISACLLGQPVRYDGTHKKDAYISEVLAPHFRWEPVCPEVECGLGVPREAMHLIGNPEAPRLVTKLTGLDHTERMNKWTDKRLARLEKLGLRGFIFKSKSPSSGLAGVPVMEGNKRHLGQGLFARALVERFPLLPVCDEVMLSEPGLRESFLQRVFVLERWEEFLRSGGKLNELVEFHARHKYLLLAHGNKPYRELGRLVAHAKYLDPAELNKRYIALLMRSLSRPSNTGGNVNVLEHMAGYFKDRLDRSDRAELKALISEYRLGFVPLAAPLVLIRHHARKFEVEYLLKQHYLTPHPIEHRPDRRT